MPTSPPPRFVRLLQGLAAVALALAVFGICVPFTLIDLGAIPNMGLVNGVYVLAGAVAGVVIGIVGSVRTVRVPSWFPRPYLVFVGTMSLVVVAAMIAASYFGAFAHI